MESTKFCSNYGLRRAINKFRKKKGPAIKNLFTTLKKSNKSCIGSWNEFISEPRDWNRSVWNQFENYGFQNKLMRADHCLKQKF